MELNRINKILIALSIFIIIIFLYSLILRTSVDKDTVQADNGLLDLSNRDFSERGSVYLAGEWAFYYNDFVDPQAGELTPEDILMYLNYGILLIIRGKPLELRLMELIG